MGTRSLTAVTFGDKMQIARVGLFDGAPTQTGVEILSVLKEENGLSLCDWLYRCTELEDAEYNKFFNNGVLNKTALTEAYPDFFFGSAAELFRTLINSDRDPVIHNDYNFAYDSLQCEWAYIIDFKEWTFEIYKGFNKTPLAPEDRFYNGGYRRGEYYPVNLIKKYDLNNLPAVDTFISEMGKSTETVNERKPVNYRNIGIYSICRIMPDGDAETYRKYAEAEVLALFNPKEKNYTLYMDEVVLGQKCERKELDRMIEDALSGKIDFILIAEAGDLWHSPQKVWDTICRLRKLETKVKIRCHTENQYWHQIDSNSKLFDEPLIHKALKVSQRDTELQFLSANWDYISPYTQGEILARNIPSRLFGDVVMYHTFNMPDEEYETFIKSFGEDKQNIDDVIDCWDRRSPCFDTAVEIMAEKIITYFLI